MPLTELRVGDQTIRHDREATEALYSTLLRGSSDDCNCRFCLNFRRQRNVVYPPSFRTLLEQLGLDANKEGGAFTSMPRQDDWQSYSGWFSLVGEMVTAGERNCTSPDSPHFEFFFRTDDRVQQSPMLVLEFMTKIRWVLGRRRFRPKDR